MDPGPSRRLPAQPLDRSQIGRIMLILYIPRMFCAGASARLLEPLD